jgi:hypothetical protein
MSSCVLPVWLMLLSAEYANSDRFNYVADRSQHLLLTYELHCLQRNCIPTILQVLEVFLTLSANVPCLYYGRGRFRLISSLNWFTQCSNSQTALHIPPLFLLTILGLTRYIFGRVRGKWDCPIVMLFNTEKRGPVWNQSLQNLSGHRPNILIDKILFANVTEMKEIKKLLTQF